MSLHRPKIRLLHTSDVHIGDDTNLGRPTRRLAGLTKVVDIAIREEADVLLIAGDFFDNSRVSSSHIEAAWYELARLSIPIALTPGNHDCLEAPSIYDRVRPPDTLHQLCFLNDPDGSHVVLPDLSLTIWARGLVQHHPEHFPLLGYQPHLEQNWQIGMAHGHYVPKGEIANGSSPLLEEQIADMKCDYLALGHWHDFADVSSNGTSAFYSGSPSESFSTFASVNLVTLDPATGVHVDRISLD